MYIPKGALSSFTLDITVVSQTKTTSIPPSLRGSFIVEKPILQLAAG